MRIVSAINRLFNAKVTAIKVRSKGKLLKDSAAFEDLIIPIMTKAGRIAIIPIKEWYIA